MESHGLTRGAAPWTGMPGRWGYTSKRPLPRKFDVYTELHNRRTEEELQTLLDERLAELRSRPGWDREVDRMAKLHGLD